MFIAIVGADGRSEILVRLVFLAPQRKEMKAAVPCRLLGPRRSSALRRSCAGLNSPYVGAYKRSVRPADWKSAIRQ
jgi:hypothetical protein